MPTESKPMIWNEMRYQLRNVYGDYIDQMKFSHITPDVADNVLYLSLPSKIDSDSFSRIYLPRLKEILHRKAPDMKLKLVSGQFNDKLNDRTNNQLKDKNFEARKDINPGWTFESYVRDISNQVAYDAVKSFCDDASSNILFLQANVGHGKSHLLHAATNYWQSKNPNKRFKIISAAGFTFEFVQSLKNVNDSLSFHNNLRKLDALFFDDMHFVVEKKATIKALFQGIEQLTSTGKQVMITSKLPLDKLAGLEDWMKSRIAGATSVKIETPSEDLRNRVVSLYMQSNKTVFSNDVRDLLVHRLPGSLRELRGAVKRLYLYTEHFGKDQLDENRAKEILADMLRENRQIKLDDIRKCVADYYGLTVSKFCERTRERSVARPRQIAMYLAKKMTSKSLPEIGRCFGRRDHTTVIYAIRHIEDLQKKDSEIQENIKILRERILDGAS